VLAQSKGIHLTGLVPKTRDGHYHYNSRDMRSDVRNLARYNVGLRYFLIGVGHSLRSTHGVRKGVSTLFLEVSCATWDGAATGSDGLTRRIFGSNDEF